MNDLRYKPGILKLIHHQEHLRKIEAGEVVGPIHLSVFPNNQCQLACPYCCFNKTLRNDAELSLEDFTTAIDVLSKYGLKATEMSLRGDEILYLEHNNEFKVVAIKDFVELYNKKEKYYAWSIKDNKIKGIIDSVYSHPNNKDLIKITLVNGKSITTTEDHSVFFYEKSQIISKQSGTARAGDWVVMSKSKLDINTASEKEIDLTPFDHTRKNRQNSIIINKDVCRLLGYFNAEGSYQYCRGIIHGMTFCFDNYNQESEYIDDVVGIFEKYFHYSPAIRKDDNRTTIYITKKWIGELFKFLECGEKSQSMRVPNIIFNLDDICRMEYLKGLFAGDGNYRSTITVRGGIEYFRNALQLKTSSFDLIKTVSLLLDIMGIENSVVSGTNNERFFGTRKVKPSPYYSLGVTGYSNLKKIEPVITYLHKEMKYKNNTLSQASQKSTNHRIHIINDDAVAVQIKKIERITDINEMVYDISVKNTNRFESSFRILCHNSGGGDPLLWSHFSTAVSYVYNKGLKLSLVTNGLAIKGISSDILNKFNWIRVSIQSVEYAKKLDLSNIPADVKTSMSYIVYDDKSIAEISKLYDYAKENDVIIRVTCIRPCTLEFEQRVYDEVQRYGKPLIMFKKEPGVVPGCYMLWIRAALDWNANFLPCPSIELSPEYAGKIPADFGVCKVGGIEEYLISHKPHDLGYRCSFCNCGKDSNDYIHNLLQEISDVDFV